MNYKVPDELRDVRYQPRHFLNAVIAPFVRLPDSIDCGAQLRSATERTTDGMPMSARSSRGMFGHGQSRGAFAREHADEKEG